ncbi:hypothetical protein LH23_10695 [Cedecea neteri]|uniref:Uncharacterized protein n=1 Tax=Cedecea neteri TaxID=158822 RepID=A0AAN0VTA8_9ENTR|nr:hypothetical protein [Cedecea neteri]AIR61117.1 hypothetical protein LH23_10695 [Cedecea neteri]
MTQNGFNPDKLLGENRWEEALHQWTYSFPVSQLGIQLVSLLREITPADIHPLLGEMHQQYCQYDNARRWRIFEQAQKQELNTPTGALALSLFWASGSMSPDDLPAVYPDPKLASQMLNCAVVMLAVGLGENPVEGTRNLMMRCQPKETL